MIVSASRRTDIPAFYSEWFMNRVQDGFLLIRNPFNANQIKRVSLLKEDVDAFVFWTRNAEKLLPQLPLLDAKGFRYYFQYTITGYPRALEKSVPQTLRAIKTFCEVSQRIGPGRVVWRYDPILVSSLVDLDEHKRIFAKIASMLSGKTRRVVISFADLYKKTTRNLDAVPSLVYRDVTLTESDVMDLVRFMSETAKSYGIDVQSCAEKINLSCAGIEHGKCIDDELLRSEFGMIVPSEKDKGQREECGCVKSIDIGQYNTCLHGCAYCYATFSEGSVVKNKQRHNPRSPFLVGEVEGCDEALLSLGISQQGVLF